jgi:uncharacterized protein (TIGR04255 family)
MEKNNRELGNPPVIEAWIEFEIDLTEEIAPWDKETSLTFIRTSFPDFTETDFCLFLGDVKVDLKSMQSAPSKLIIDRVRAFTKEKDKCIQVGRNALVFNQIKKGPWPKFEKCRDQAFDALAKYMAFRQLSKLRTVALHYRDMVQIPKGSTNIIQLDDYFTICPKVPEEKFGAINQFRFAMELMDFCEQSRIILSMQSVPSQTSPETHYRFVMDWHLIPKQEITDVDSGRKWLDEAHGINYNAFIAAFTEKGFALFE